MKHAVPIILATLASVAFAPPGIAAEDSLPMRAASRVGVFIASQGNAALMEIRDELKKDLLKRLEPYLPARDEIAPDNKLAELNPQS